GGDPLAAEEAHQVVFQRNVELRGPGVALAACTAAELTVYPATLMPFGADDGQASRFFYAGPQLDIRTPSRHVGGNGDGPCKSRLGDHLGCPGVLFGIQYV